MALKVQSSFSAGEIDPALHERTTLEKFKSGLATGRNVIIGKTGRILSRHSRKFFLKTKLERRTMIHTMSHNGSFLEWGHEYVRVYSLDGQLIGDYAHDWTEDDMDFIQFNNIDFYTVQILRHQKTPKILTVYPGGGFVTGFFGVPPECDSITATKSGSAGYDVHYAVTAVIRGEETQPIYFTSSGVGLPIAAGQYNTIQAIYLASDIPPKPGSTIDDALQEMRFYRRPAGGGEYGYIGSTTFFTASNTFDRQGEFIDHGQQANYGVTPPTLSATIRDKSLSGPEAFRSKTACMYQQRLVMAYDDKLEASRNGFPNNFYRDYPLSSTSALSFRTAGGNVLIHRLIDSEGLVAFTSDGIYHHVGALTPTNLGMEKRGNWIIDDRVPPIAIPGGVLFVDASTNTVRQLSWSQERGSYIGEELSIFSNHLFENNRIVSWAYQDGEFPLLWVVFKDGSLASFTYEREHMMRAWTRHDTSDSYSRGSVHGVEYVASTTNGINQLGDPPTFPAEVLFVTRKGNARYIEKLIPRYVSVDTQEKDPEWDKNESIMAADAIVSWKHMIDDDLLDPEDYFQLQSISFPNTDGLYYLKCVGSTPIFKEGGLGEPGTLFRWFNPENRTYIDFEVIERTDDQQVTVYIDIDYDDLPFPTSGIISRIYECRSTFNNDSKVELSDNILDLLIDDDLVVTPVNPDGWTGKLILSTTDDAIFTDPGPGEVGTPYYYKMPNGSIRNYIVSSRTDDNEIILEWVGGGPPAFPSSDDTNPAFYLGRKNLFSLEHLAGESISVIGDGSVVASPNNDVDNYPVITVSGSGGVTLPKKYAIVHFGRPFTADVETLDVDTVEQKPSLIESKTVNKVYIKTYRSRGLFIGSRFPANDTVRGEDVNAINMIEMTTADAYTVNYEEENPILGNTYDQPKTRRLEVILGGDWYSNGRIAIRQVDPVHFEILSIILDLEVEWRNDRG